MNYANRWRKKVVVVFVTAVCLTVLARSASASHVTPTVIAGNPSCTSLSYDFGFKPQPEPPPSGTYFFGDPVTSPAHAPTGDSVTITSDGTFFDWTSTLGIDAVIVKGGSNANVYVYDPPAEAFSDTGLHSPINPSNNQPFGISHIEFCYDFEVTVSKNANPSFTRTFEWSIDKSVTPGTWDLFTGDSGTSKYTVTVTKTGFTDSDWAVSGSITIDNATPFNATITGVTDVVSPAIAAAVDCGVTFPHVLAAGGTLTCTYSTSLPDGSNRTNTATVTTSGAVGGGQATAVVTFGAPTTVVNGTINVNDTVGGDLGTFSDSGSAMYDRTFTCDGDEGTHNNTATIVETGQSDSASVTVNCYELVVTKDADTSLTRTWTWTIDKSADQSELTLSPGQQFQVNYEVTVDATSVDSEWAVRGNIWIANSNPTRDASLTAVSDVVSPNIAASVNCPSLTVPAGGSLHCTYSADLPDDTTRTNTATATLQNVSYDSMGTGTPLGTTDFSGTANVDFSSATLTEIDECVDVSDTNLEPSPSLGTVCADSAPTTFSYSILLGPFSDPEDCGEQQHQNTASFTTNDTQTKGSDSWTVNILVPCEVGCTLTPGYWKTHSEFGPAPFDDTWSQLANGASTPFFLSGQTYYEVLWTPPKGNAYYILAHAYIAAELNQLNGASVPTDVMNAFDSATDLFNTYTPDQVAAFKGKDGTEIRAMFIGLADILDNYNNGLTGPGHCSEENNTE